MLTTKTLNHKFTTALHTALNDNINGNIQQTVNSIQILAPM